MTRPAPPFDSAMMRIALRMAGRGLGTAAPNPAVGAVIADEATGEVIARGWTQPGGRPHAETEAIGRAAARARGATLYVTLEPCAHHGKTPPCTDAIIAAGARRVVIGIGDPDPRTAGEGIARLRGAGLTVSVGVLEREARWVTLGHILRITKQRPFVTLKLATDAAGAVAPGDGRAPRWVTGPEARAAGHLLRAEADAILVGSGTIDADNPDLTCRLPGLEHRSPVRIVLGGRNRLNPASRLFATARTVPVIVYREGVRGEEDRQLEASGAEVVPLQESLLPTVLAHLAGRGLTRLLVEGGPKVWRSFAEAGLVDEVVLFMAGHGGASDALRALEAHIGAIALEMADHRPVGPDTMWRLRRVGA